jgi:hypothetical protein
MWIQFHWSLKGPRLNMGHSNVLARRSWCAIILVCSSSNTSDDKHSSVDSYHAVYFWKDLYAYALVIWPEDHNTSAVTTHRMWALTLSPLSLPLPFIDIYIYIDIHICVCVYLAIDTYTVILTLILHIYCKYFPSYFLLSSFGKFNNTYGDFKYLCKHLTVIFFVISSMNFKHKSPSSSQTWVNIGFYPHLFWLLNIYFFNASGIYFCKW